MKNCPYCGAEIHDAASFCPRCAKTLNRRDTLAPPRYFPKRARYIGLAVLCAGLLLLGLYWWRDSLPETFESDTGEVQYGEYRLFFSFDDPPGPVMENNYHCMMDYPYRYLVPLYVTNADGRLAAGEFLEQMASITAEIPYPRADIALSCMEPQIGDEGFPDAVAVLYIDLTLLTPGDYEVDLVCTMTMKNGDVIELRQPQRYDTISTYNISEADAPLDTIDDLRYVLGRAEKELDEYDVLYITLPAVVYEGGLELAERNIGLKGRVGPDGQRTAFTGPIVVSGSGGRGVRELENIDFTGQGEGVGVTASETVRLHLINCRVSGWETGFLAVGKAWINADETVFEDNGVGMCFNVSDTPLVSDTIHVNDLFRNNGTAVQLLRTGSEYPLKYPGCRFSGNGTDFDNPCGQELDISEASFDS